MSQAKNLAREYWYVERRTLANQHCVEFCSTTASDLEGTNFQLITKLQKYYFRRPIYIDLAVDGPAFGIPGSVGALMVERPADPVEGFDVKAPILYHFGHSQPNGNIKLYLTLINRLQDIFNTKCLYNPKAHSSGKFFSAKFYVISGCIINTCGWVRNQGYDVLLEVAKSFEADVVLCLDTEKLYHDLKRDLPGFVHVMHLQKSPGVTPRNKDQRRELRDFQIRQYFEGSTLELYPHSFDVKISDIEVYKVFYAIISKSQTFIDWSTSTARIGATNRHSARRHTNTTGQTFRLAITRFSESYSIDKSRSIIE